ncbi:cell envelope integrity protein CreD [Kordiimonas aestuarii]|uniref:cell envelope integrity protein CreD n=1 Tax=Kordiimonas aestuarii TaxID=1005925 RepID=UPI0021D0B6F1|nr:cell envelope integrity protein CreD [Kordiimonas aestuarii]
MSDTGDNQVHSDMGSENSRFMQFLNGYGVKSVLIGLMLLIMLIPLSMIGSLVNERSGRAREADMKIGEVWGHEQIVGGPMLVVPYEAVEKIRKTGELVTLRRQLVLLPDRLTVGGVIDVESRRLGLYSSNVYTANLTMTGTFTIPDIDTDTLEWGKATVSLFLDDLQGLQGDIVMTVDGKDTTIKPATGLEHNPSGVHVQAADLAPGRSFAAEGSFSLRGMRALNIWPSGTTSDIQLSSAWPSPGFHGRFSPISRTVSKDGFDARWQTLRLAQGIGPVLSDGAPLPVMNTVTVNFIDPVNTYSLTDRSVKYGSLFVLLTFAVIYLFEVVSGSKVHPVQYILIGLALCLFFMGLLSLAEHMAFTMAYIVSSTLIVGLVTAYACSVTKSRSWTVGICLTQTALLGFLYGVLNMEDFALLAGTTLMFVALAVAMYLTRNVDWYKNSAPGDKA